MSRNLNRREQLDVTGMLKEAPSANSEAFEDGIVWYEWIASNNHNYHLSYWFDSEAQEYKAAITEGLKPNEKLPGYIFPDGMIDINHSYTTIASEAVEARSRALTILKSLGDVTNVVKKKLRLMTLGFSNAGKTFYLGALGKLSHNPGAKGFSLQAEKFILSNEIAKLYQVVAGDKEGAIPTTVDLRPHLMVLKQGMNPLLEIEITDIEGQALEPGRNTVIAQKILQQIGDHDGLILILEAPKTPSDSEKCKFQVAQMLNFAGELLKVNKPIPLTLVLTKIDQLPGAEEVITRLNEETKIFEDNLKKRYKNFAEIKRQIQNEKGSVYNKFVKEIVSTMEIFEVYDTFFSFLRPTEMEIPNKVFPCSSMGFNVLNQTQKSDIDMETYRSQYIYQPYGSAASFLWTIYASFLSQPKENLEKLINGKNLDSLKDDLLEEIRELHTSGQAYFDPEAEDPSVNIFALRNIANLKTHQIY
jgi:hypothetical protein